MWIVAPLRTWQAQMGTRKLCCWVAWTWMGQYFAAISQKNGRLPNEEGLLYSLGEGHSGILVVVADLAELLAVKGFGEPWLGWFL
jgi:hypothetical protein